MKNGDSLRRNPSQFDDSFTVHNYTTLRSTSLAGAASADLLSSAQNLIKGSSSRHNPESWENMRDPDPIVWVPRKLYAYNLTPPSNLGGTHVSELELKEWGAPADENERWCLADLTDFQSTHFSNVLTEVAARNLQRPTKRPSSTEPQDVGDAPSAAKRRRLDDGPLHGVVARPHIYPSQQLNPKNSSAPSLKPYKRTIPIMVPPYSNPLPDPSTYERRAWMIPIRGTLPWNNTSPAEMLHQSEAVPIAPAPRSLETVVWSWKALQEFWDFLKILRSEGKLGTLGLSFHASPVYKRSAAHLASNTAARSNEVAHGGLDSGLSAVDYIKVYHDAVKSMFLRTVFDLWAYQMKDEDGVLIEKIRVLKGAKIVLVDHMSRGMLVS